MAELLYKETSFEVILFTFDELAKAVVDGSIAEAVMAINSMRAPFTNYALLDRHDLAIVETSFGNTPPINVFAQSKPGTATKYLPPWHCFNARFLMHPHTLSGGF